ncbi:MAG: efflux RND transporter periplasmic adaptor subunit [Rhodospirillales bacterium]|nr:efflux RND transporter periplasmic adaptor subunit [Rhodospirillales bacterium]
MANISGVKTVHWIIALLAIGAVAAAMLWWPSGGPKQTTSAGRPPPPVTVSKPASQEIVEWKEFTGQFEAAEYVEIRAKVSGYLMSIHFKDGQLVNKDDLLFVIDPRPFEIELESAEAQLTQARSKLELANQQLERTTELRKKDIATASSLDERIEDVRFATAAVEVAKAAVHAAKLDLEYTRLTAPVRGRVSRHEVSVGNLIAGGSSGNPTLLTTIVSLDPIHFLFDVSEADALAYKRAIKRGEIPSARDETVTVYGQFSDEQNWPMKGTIDFVDSQIDRSSGTLRVRAVFPNEDLFITPGQFGRLRAPASAKFTALLIPEKAIVTDQSNKLALTVTEDGTVVPKVLTLGPRVDGDLRVVRSGLAPDDLVIINGLLRARPGSKVTPEVGEIQTKKLTSPE